MSPCRQRLFKSMVMVLAGLAGWGGLVGAPLFAQFYPGGQYQGWGGPTYVVPGYGVTNTQIGWSVQQRQRPVAIGDNPYPVSGVGRPNPWVTTHSEQINIPTIVPGYYVGQHPGIVQYHGHGGYWGNGNWGQGGWGNCYPYRGYGPTFVPQPVAVGIITPGYLPAYGSYQFGGWGGAGYGYSSSYYSSRQYGVPLLGQSRVEQLLQTNGISVRPRTSIHIPPELEVELAAKRSRSVERQLPATGGIASGREVSSARKGARSLASIERERAAKREHSETQGLKLIAQGDAAKERGEKSVARLYYRMAAEVLGEEHPTVLASLEGLQQPEVASDDTKGTPLPERLAEKP